MNNHESVVCLNTVLTILFKESVLRKVMAPSSGVYERRGGIQAVAFYDRRICGFTPSESLLFVAIVTLVFLRVTLVGAAVALPSHHNGRVSPAAIVRGCGIRAPANALHMTDISDLMVFSSEVPCHFGDLAGKCDLYANFRGAVASSCGVAAAQPVSSAGSGRRAAESLNLREESFPAISASSLSSPICFQSVPQFTLVSGFGPSLDGLPPTASTPRLS